MRHKAPRLALVLSFVAAACSSGGAGTVMSSDGGIARSPAFDAAVPNQPSDVPGPSVNDAGLRADAKKPNPTSYPVTCEGLCAKADAKLPEGCDAAKCVSQCGAREQAAANAAAGGCDAEWATYLECAVLGGTMTTCAFNGKLTLAGCSDEEQALSSCVSKPKTCPSNCTTDQQCQLQCPGSRVTCCDKASGYCYAANSTSCN